MGSMVPFESTQKSTRGSRTLSAWHLRPSCYDRHATTVMLAALLATPYLDRVYGAVDPEHSPHGMLESKAVKL
ncbi:hypothetical protein CLOP_g1975 [Closterium sp. NIES-67]|nr:hypothetical protein CLOP_g1975 [Closterium sp. NIES-67]